MESDKQFAWFLDQLRQAHESLRLEHEHKVAKLEAEVAQFRGSSLPPAAEVVEAARDGQPEIQSKVVELDVSGDLGDAGEDGVAIIADSDAAPVQPPTPNEQPATGASRQESAHAHHTHHQLSLQKEEDSRAEKFWDRFDAIIGAAIIVYTCVLFLGLHIDGVTNERILEHAAPPDFSGASAIVSATNHTFNVFFLLEFLIRVYYFRLRYFYNDELAGVAGIQWFNLFDSLLVWLTVLEAYVLSQLSMNVSYIRCVRIIRLARSLRVVRTFRVFTSLRILVATVAASFLALFWSMVLLAIVMLLGSLSLCQLLGGSVTDEGLALETRDWVNRYYGTPGRSLYSFFELTFSGGWPTYARTLIEDVSGLYAIFFFIYISGVVFAMTRIITALFLKDTLAIANSDADIQINAKMKEKKAYAKKLQDFFEEVDTSGDGFITQEEFTEMLEEPRAAAYLAYLEIDASESLHLFHIMDDGDGRISSEEFVKSALRLKGCARAQDIIILMHELEKVKRHVLHIDRVAQAMRDGVRAIGADLRN